MSGSLRRPPWPRRGSTIDAEAGPMTRLEIAAFLLFCVSLGALIGLFAAVFG